MWRAFTSLLALVLLAAAVLADARPEGLLWNRSGLAATLPLQIKTDAHADYLLQLRDIETEQVVLAAYVRGGAYFRVLVPPGQFDVMFSYGTTWQGEEALFGPETQSFVLDQPLSFGATVRHKHGHLIDLRGETDIVVRDFAFCQRLALDLDSLRRRDVPVGKPRGYPPYSNSRLLGHARYSDGRLLGPPRRTAGLLRNRAPYPVGLPTRDPRDPIGRLHTRPHPDRFRPPEFVTPRYDLRSRVCD
ncbi:MAG: hypothetical protein AAFU80_14520 [Pseudomonadota bacterium]